MQSGNNPVKRAGFENFLTNHDDVYNHYWEIRVAIDPRALVLSDDNNQVGKIKQIVKDVFGKSGCIAKVMTFGNEESILTEGYDGTTNHAGMDRDQRGKEICISVPDAQFNKLTTDEYKRLMLRLWFKLVEANIPLEFICVPGDKKVEGANGYPTPFSISSKYPDRNEWNDLHGILYKEYIPCEEHPLQNVSFTNEELIKAGIILNSAKILRQHNRYHIENLDISRRSLQLEIKSILGQDGKYSDAIGEQACNVVKALCARYENFETDKSIGERQTSFENLCKENKLIQFLLNALPHTRDKHFAQDGDALNKLSRLYRYTPQQIEDLFRRLQAQFAEEKAAIKSDFARHQNGNDLTPATMRIDWSEYISGYTEVMLDEMIDRNPAAVQILFRHIVSNERRAREHRKFEAMIESANRIPGHASNNFIFVYDTTTGIVNGVKPAHDSVHDIKCLPISQFNQDSNIRSGWVKFNNERVVAEPRKLGKWVLRFSNGDKKIDEAWQTLVDLVAQNKLFEVKASVQNDQFDDQCICVYVADGEDMEEVVRVYDLLRQHGLLELHNERQQNDGNIDFILDESTRLHKSKPSFSGRDISVLHELFKRKDEIAEAAFNVRFAHLAEPFKMKVGAVLNDNFEHRGSDEDDGVMALLDDEVNDPEAVKIATLRSKFGKAPVYQRLKDFALEVEQLQNCEHVREDVKSEFNYLYRVIESELLNHASCNFKDTPQSVVLEHFTNLAREIKNNKEETRDLNYLKTNLQTLDVKLARKPPMSKNLKAVICGVIGAIVGAALGFVVGAAITLWAGGFGSIPAAIAASVLGYSIGIGVGAAIGGAGGAAIGFFHSKRAQARKEVYEAESEILLNKVRLAG